MPEGEHIRFLPDTGVIYLQLLIITDGNISLQIKGNPFAIWLEWVVSNLLHSQTIIHDAAKGEQHNSEIEHHKQY